MAKNSVATEVEPEVPQAEIDAASAELEKERAEEKPKEEVKPEAEKPEEKKEEKKHKYTDEEGKPLVRLDALHESRAQLKQMRQEIVQREQERQRRDAILEQRLQMLYQAQNPPPDPQTDPEGYRNLQIAQAQQEIAGMRQRQQFEDAQRQQGEQVQALVGWAQSQSEEFKSETPDFQDAYNFIRNKRAAELKAMGLDAQSLQQTLVNDELWVFQHAAQSQRNPAEILYQMAIANGYGKKAQAVSPEQKMDALQKGLQAAKSLDGGTAAGGKPTAEQIASMSEDEFAEVMKKYGSLKRALA